MRKLNAMLGSLDAFTHVSFVVTAACLRKVLSFTGCIYNSLMLFIVDEKIQSENKAQSLYRQ